jgi:uncharacterized membrane protein
MSKRAITAKQRAWLLDELNVWRQGSVVSEQQAQRIADLYEGAGELAERGRSRSVFILMSAAALLVGLAALLLIGYNWSQLDRWTKLAVVLGTIAVTHAIGFSLRYRRNAGNLSETVLFLGCLFYGAGIWLIAQVFHINAHYPDGFWWWAVGVLPFALCLETRLLHALLVGVLAAWAGTEILNFSFLGGWLFGRWGAIPNGAYSLPLLALPGIVWSYRKQSVQTLSLYVPLLAWWAVLQIFAWRLGANPIYFLGSIGALLLVIAECHAVGSRFAIPYRYYGALLVGGALVPLSFFQLNKHLSGQFLGRVGPSVLLLVVALAIVAISARRQRGDSAIQAEPGSRAPRVSRSVVVASRQAIPLALSLLMALLPLLATISRASGAGGALLPTLLVNAAMVAGAFWLMQVGLQEDRGRPFGAGVVYFLLWAVLRYVDLFGVRSMIGAAMMFFACGGVLFAVGRYWQGRREVRYA